LSALRSAVSLVYDALRRPEVKWKINEKAPLNTIAAEMAEEKSACAIVNLRAHARKLYNELLKHCDNEDELFFLTTDFCPLNRSRIVEEIKARLYDGLPCCLVATQCIEVGVDLDFAVLYGALAPLDSIVQAAGRCNRNGSLERMGKVTVFIPEEPEPLYPGGKGNSWYETAATKVKLLSREHPIDIRDPRHMEEYYALLFQLDISITRMAIADGDTLEAALKAEQEKSEDNLRTMGRKQFIPFGLYEVRGFISANLAAETGFDDDDLKVLFEAILNMYELQQGGRCPWYLRLLSLSMRVPTATCSSAAVRRGWAVPRRTSCLIWSA